MKLFKTLVILSGITCPCVPACHSMDVEHGVDMWQEKVKPLVDSEYMKDAMIVADRLNRQANILVDDTNGIRTKNRDELCALNDEAYRLAARYRYRFSVASSAFKISQYEEVIACPIHFRSTNSSDDAVWLRIDRKQYDDAYERSQESDELFDFFAAYQEQFCGVDVLARFINTSAEKGFYSTLRKVEERRAQIYDMCNTSGEKKERIECLDTLYRYLQFFQLLEEQVSGLKVGGRIVHPVWVQSRDKKMVCISGYKFVPGMSDPYGR